MSFEQLWEQLIIEGSLEQFLRGSKVKHPVYHGTIAKFDKFKHGKGGGDLGIHFGTRDQAEDRIHAKGFDTYREEPEPHMIRKVYLSLTNPIKTRDAGGWQFPKKVKQVIEDAGVKIDTETIPDRNYSSEENAAAIKLIRAELVAKGYDGVIYSNTAERAGTSYIVFSPDQIRPAEER